MPQVPVVYYIAPQMWVWWSNRRDIARIVEITDKLLAVFPEEARYFRAQGAKLAGWASWLTGCRTPLAAKKLVRA